MNEDWRDRAACKGRPLDAFFKTKPPVWVRVLCESCPAAASCLVDALETGVEGWRAGTSTAERLRIRERAGYRAHRRRAS